MKLRLENARFEAACGSAEQLLAPTTPEVCFVGRSNVGKSSLLNRLVGRKALAKVSGKPGKTATINFFFVDGVRLVDLPGYGYAKVSERERERWAQLIAAYFEQERSFNLVIALIDIRHDAQALDQEMIAYLRDGDFPFIVVLTKADKLSRSRQLRQQALLARQLNIEPERMLICSSETGQGTNDILRWIEQSCL